MMSKTQTKIINELRMALSNASSFEIVDQTEFTGKVKEFMSVVSRDYQSHLRNQFEVGPRGGLTVIKQEFDARY